LQCESYVGN